MKRMMMKISWMWLVVVTTVGWMSSGGGFVSFVDAKIAGTTATAAATTTFRPRRRVGDVVAQKQRTESETLKTSTIKTPLLSTDGIPRGGVVVENTLPNAILGTIAMALIEKCTKAGFKAADINFPSQLGACLVLFVFLLVCEPIVPGLANAIFVGLSPGAAFLAKWLPVFFVPGLAMLPLAPSIGDTSEVIKVLAVVVLGWVYSLMTTTFTVLALRKAQGSLVTTPPVKAASTTASSKGPAPKPFSDQTMGLFFKGSVLFGVATLIGMKTDIMGDDVLTPVRTLFLGFATVAAYVWGARLPASFTKMVHPLVTSCCILLCVVQLLGMATSTSFLDVLRTYKVGSLDLKKAGAGDVLLYLLGPSVVSFAISMYSRRVLLRKNLLVVIISMLCSSVGGLFGTAAFVRAIALGGADGKIVRLSVLPRNVTTALAIALTNMIGGDISIAASVVVMTGILGATYGKTFLTNIGVYDPICRGLGIGGSSQGLGVASISDEPDAFPFAAISMVLTAMCSTTLVTFPAVKDTLINLACGAPKTIIAEAAGVSE